MDVRQFLLDRLSPGHLLEDPYTPESPIYLVLLGVFALALVAGLGLSFGSGRIFGERRFHRRLAERYGTWAAWLGGAGIVIVAVRYTNVQMLSKRIWLVLDTLALIALVGHFIWYRVRRYPQALAAYTEEERRRKYVFTARREGARRRRRR